MCKTQLGKSPETLAALPRLPRTFRYNAIRDHFAGQTCKGILLEKKFFQTGKKREQVEFWFQVGEDCIQGSHQLSAIEKQATDRLVETSLSQHRLRGAWCSESKIVVVQLLDTERVRSWRSGEIACLPYGWAGGTFGGSLTLTVLLKDPRQGEPSTCRASIFLGDPMLNVIRNESFVLVVANGKQILRSVLVDYLASNDSQRTIRSFIDSVAEEEARGWIDPEANFWETLYHQSIFHNYLSVSDELSLGWYQRVAADAPIRTVLRTLVEKGFADVCRGLSLDDDALGFVNAVHGSQGDFRIVRDYLLNQLQEDRSRTIFMFAKQLNKLPDVEEYGFPLSGCSAILHAFLDSSEITKCGKALPWVSAEGQLLTLDLEPRKFPNHVNPREYWTRRTRTLCFGWGHLLGGGDVVVSESELEDMLPQLPYCDDAEVCEEQANFLLAEASANKLSCIPSNAVVQIAIGPYHSIELREIGESVILAFRHQNGLVYFFTCEPGKLFWDAALPYDEEDPEAEFRIHVILSALKLLVAAVIRDFWVVEHREAIFEQRNVQRLSHGTKKDSGPRIVYLPRVKYECRENPNVASCANELDSMDRRSHLVAGHVRKSRNPSKHQIALAERYGFSLPEGYTFVRPHERGNGNRDVIYRSRSALRSLYTVTDTQGSTGEVKWFRFERDVQALMQALGFTVEHVAASRRGDNGVDVYATKGVDLDAVRWVIQCKCWSSKRKVSPSVVRELSGTLTRYSSGTRGMIVTTSGFTRGAEEAAADHEIRLMDGEEFARRVFGVGQK